MFMRCIESRELKYGACTGWLQAWECCECIHHVSELWPRPPYSLGTKVYKVGLFAELPEFAMDLGFCHYVMAHHVGLAWRIMLWSRFAPWLLQRVSSIAIKAPLIKYHMSGCLPHVMLIFDRATLS
jgi:hypothetical protein